MLTNIILMMCGYFVVVLVILGIAITIRKRQKGEQEFVQIIVENDIRTGKKYPIKGNKVLIEKPKTKGRGHSGWMPEYTRDCFLYYVAGHFPFKKLKRKLMVVFGASKCIEFKGKKGVEVPVYDRETAKKLFEAEVIQHAGASTQKVTVPIFVYLLLFICLMLGIVNILVGSGRIYF